MSWKEYPINVKVRLLTSFLNRIVSQAIMPFMALFFAQELGKVWAGVFLIGTVAISFLTNLIGGYISDRYKRKQILIFTASLNTLMFLLMTISLIPDNYFIALFAFGYVGFTVANSLGRPAMQAIILDSTTTKNRKAVFATDYWLTNISLAIGTAVGGMMYADHKLILFTMLAIVSLALPIAYYIWIVDSSVKILKQKYRNIGLDLLHNYKVAVQDMRFVKVTIGAMCIFSIEMTLNNYIGVRLAEAFVPMTFIGFKITGVKMLSILAIENMLLVALLTFLINRCTDTFSRRKVLLWGLALYGIGYGVLLASNSYIMLLAFMFIASIGEMVYAPTYSADQAKIIPEDRRGSYSAFSSIGFNGASLIGRSTIIIGIYLTPIMMSVVYVATLTIIGALLIMQGLYAKNTNETKEELNCKYN